MIEAHKAQVIHLKLVSKKIYSNEQDKASALHLQSNSSFSCSDTEDDEFIDLSEAGLATSSKDAKQVPAIEQLRQLQGRLRGAILQAEGQKLFELKRMQMPVLEALIRELTPDNRTDTLYDVPGLEGVTFLRDPARATTDIADGSKGRRLQNDTEDEEFDYQSRSFTFPGVKETQRVGRSMREDEHLRLAQRPLSLQEQPPKTSHRPDWRPSSASPRSKPNSADLPRDWPSVRKLRAPQQSVLAPGPTVARSAPATTRSLRGYARTYRSAPVYIPRTHTSDILTAGQPVSVGIPPSYGPMTQPLPLNQARTFNFDPSASRDNNSAIYYQPLGGRFALHGCGVTESPNDQTKSQRSGTSNRSMLLEAEPGAENLQEKPRIKKLLKLARKEVHRALKNGKPTSTEHVTIPVEELKGGHLPIFLWSIENTSNIRKSQSVTSALTTEGREVHGSDGDGGLRQPQAPYKSGELILHTILSEIHVKLGEMNAGTCAERETAVCYQVIEGKSRLQVSDLLNSFRPEKRNVPEVESIPGDSNKADAQNWNRKQIIYDIAEKCLHAFVPIDYEGPVVAKIWGSVYRILAEKDETVLRSLGLCLKELYLLIRDIHMGVEADDGSKHAHFHIPQALPAAFQQLIVFFVISGATSNETATMLKFEECKALLVEGRKQLIQMVHTPDFRGRVGFEAVDPEALLALMMSNMMSKISIENGTDLTDVYSEYTLKLQRMVRDQASVKVYDQIKLLQEEIEVIKSVLTQQDNVLQDFRYVVCENHHNASLSVVVIERILENIERRIEDFDELQEQADTARYLAAQSISLKAENNNKAILVFTVTTITFLPLSFVTSYFGMNTSDLRNMESGQSLFWTVGAPLAFIILSLSLMAAFFESLRRRVSRVMEHLKTKYE